MVISTEFSSLFIHCQLCSPTGVLLKLLMWGCSLTQFTNNHYVSGHPVMPKDKALCKRSQALVSCHTLPPFCVQPALCVTQISSCFQAFLTAGRILDFPRSDHSAFHNWSSLIFRRETGLSELPLVLYSSSPPSTEFRKLLSCTFIKRNFFLVPEKKYSPLHLLLAICGSFIINNYIMCIYFPLHDKFCGHALYHSGLQYFTLPPRTPTAPPTPPPRTPLPLSLCSRG